MDHVFAAGIASEPVVKRLAMATTRARSNINWRWLGSGPGRIFSLDGDSRGYPVFIIVNSRLQVTMMDLPTQTTQLEP